MYTCVQWFRIRPRRGFLLYSIKSVSSMQCEQILNGCATAVLSRNLADGFNQSVHFNQTKSAVTDKQLDSKYKDISLFPYWHSGIRCNRFIQFRFSVEALVYLVATTFKLVLKPPSLYSDCVGVLCRKGKLAMAWASLNRAEALNSRSYAYTARFLAQAYLWLLPFPWKQFTHWSVSVD